MKIELRRKEVEAAIKLYLKETLGVDREAEIREGQYGSWNIEFDTDFFLYSGPSPILGKGVDNDN